MTALRTEALSKRYGAITALDAVSLSIPKGTVTALTGPNGSGKSTLLKALLGFVRPDSGSIWLSEVPVGADERYRREIGYMPQHVAFPSNLEVGECRRLLEELRPSPTGTDEELWERYRLHSIRGQAVRTLSGGTRQKLSAALAFLFRPSFLILDEPTASLDPVSAAVLKQKLGVERERGNTVLISTHLVAEVEALADSVIYLEDGKIRFVLSAAEIRSRTGQPTLDRALPALVAGDLG